MRRIDADDIRKAGLVPVGRPTNKTATQLFKYLLNQYKDIEIHYEHCINCHKRQWQWKYYKLLGLEGEKCLLKEILSKPIPKEKLEELKQKIVNNENYNLDNYKAEKYLSKNIIKMDAADIEYCHDTYCADIYVE